VAKSTNTDTTTISQVQERLLSLDAALVVIYGYDLGRKYDLRQAELLIGRSSSADIQIDQDAVSRNHAKVINAGDQILIEDLGSTNGTLINDDTVTGRVPLRNGDLLKIGRTILKFIAGGNIEGAYHEEIYRLTTIDGLTQAFNRRYFEEALDREISRAKRYTRELSLILIDIDHFKKVNDTHGHLAGDAVLKQLAALIKDKTRKEDIFARYGGEEFAMLIPEVSHANALATAEKTRRLVEGHRFEFEGQYLPLTISAGVASISNEDADGAEMLRRADAKLYEAKSAGRNRVRGDPGTR
jgi:diguanylate cyclase (GGDEF)-like protein